jgi:hypothetical protein
LQPGLDRFSVICPSGAVIPGLRGSASPESILPMVVMDSGPAPSGASRNDEGGGCAKPRGASRHDKRQRGASDATHSISISILGSGSA